MKEKGCYLSAKYSADLLYALCAKCQIPWHLPILVVWYGESLNVHIVFVWISTVGVVGRK